VKLRRLADLNLTGRRIFIRADLNVPLKEGRILDDTRVRAILPTLNFVLEKGGKPILASHLGRPKGPDPSQSLAPVAVRLREILGMDILFPGKVLGPEVEAALAGMQPGDILLLENTRFEKGEKDDDPAFARKLRGLADVYVNDAFGTAHRADASTRALAELFPERAAGLLMEKEVNALSAITHDPRRPFVAVLGGAKISGKLEVVRSLLDKADILCIGGGMANTFLKAQGREIGKSLVEDDLLGTAKEILEKTATLGKILLLPEDVRIAKSLPTDSAEVRPLAALTADAIIGDIGPKAEAAFSAHIGPARTVFWNGPMGIFEQKPFAAGTFAVARAVAECPGFTVVGGGESVAAVEQSGMASRIKHISTGGGASLEFIAGASLPALEVLKV
jgi:phosphoglycerate kinase